MVRNLLNNVNILSAEIMANTIHIMAKFFIIEIVIGSLVKLTQFFNFQYPNCTLYFLESC